MKKLLAVLALLIVVVLFIVRLQHVPLPSDEKMIAHFQEHREEFEELVSLYRTFIKRENWPELKWPSEEEGTRELWSKAGVGDVNHLSLLHWLPDPYNVSTAQYVQNIHDECTQAMKQWHAIGGNVKSLYPPPPKCRLLGYQYGVLYFKPEPRNTYWVHSWRYSTIWKTYIHFPEPPRIEDGYLLGPVNMDGEYSYKERALTSLNFYPLGWKEYECVYRRIDAHWFITLCNGH